jgi:hypothetical protein
MTGYRQPMLSLVFIDSFYELDIHHWTSVSHVIAELSEFLDTHQNLALSSSLCKLPFLFECDTGCCREHERPGCAPLVSVEMLSFGYDALVMLTT